MMLVVRLAGFVVDDRPRACFECVTCMWLLNVDPAGRMYVHVCARTQHTYVHAHTRSEFPLALNHSAERSL